MRMLGGVFQAEGTAGAKALRQYLRNFKVALWPEQNKLQQEVSLENWLGQTVWGLAGLWPLL